MVMGKEKDLKKTALYEEHKKIGAKMVPFAGWEMPVQYANIIQEHLTVRNKAGLFDVSHMGQVFINGKEALNFLQKLVPQDISKLATEKAVYTQLPNIEGGIIDDLIIYKLDDCKFLLIINASRIDEDVKWLLSNQNNLDVSIDNQSDNLSMIALQGPLASDILVNLGLTKENHPRRFFIKKAKLLNIDVLLAATGYTGEDGFEIIVKNEEVCKLWVELLSKGEKFGLKPIGLAARDTLRLEAGLFLYGQDMTENTTPVEASLVWTISKDKKEDYSGKDKILSQMNQKNESKRLVGFKMLDKSIPRHDYRIYINNEDSGVVTSGGVAPFLGENIGLGYINTDKPTAIGTKIDIMIREKLHPAEIVKRPFYVKK
ncbi:MAG TPA: glycine cleavage system aminomethyltransferase GcvT [Cyanobacteria bacterium UBA9971]|nr:glycine cleavage system aminomethyltransferase GcvT [Cyanobacteria bacterium UBA9971]